MSKELHTTAKMENPSFKSFPVDFMHILVPVGPAKLHNSALKSANRDPSITLLLSKPTTVNEISDQDTDGR